MNDEIQVVGLINDLNTTVVGSSNSGKTKLGIQFSKKGFYYLSFQNLESNQLPLEEIKSRLKMETYFIATNMQNLVISNILSLVDKGIKKIVIDELLILLDFSVRKRLLSFLNENGVKIINITTDMEDCLLTEYLIVMFDGKVALEGLPVDILKEEKILKRMGLNLPFMVDLSIQLKYYGLVDKIYLNTNDLVSELWR